MNIDKLERANILAKSLIPKVDELEVLESLIIVMGIMQLIMMKMKLYKKSMSMKLKVFLLLKKF